MQMNLDDLEKQWEDGDDLEELKTEQQAKFERLEKRRKAAEASAGTFDLRQACLFDQKRAHEIRQVCLKVVVSMRLVATTCYPRHKTVAQPPGKRPQWQ